MDIEMDMKLDKKLDIEMDNVTLEFPTTQFSEIPRKLEKILLFCE